METTERASFLTLSKHHSELDWLFNSHQRALLAKDLGLARAQLASFGNVLKRHIEVETASLLAITADRDAEIERQTVEVFQAEHDELKQQLAKLIRLSEELDRSGDLATSILLLLDEETGFKSLLRRHVSREENSIFVDVEERASEALRMFRSGGSDAR
jgi:hemerythrin-like domain-containing protein